MPVIQVTLDIKEDGQTLPGFPLTKQLTVTESQGRATYVRATSVSFDELAIGALDGVSMVFLTADQATTLRFNDQTDAGLPVNANGFVLVMDGDIPSGATSKVSVQNNSGSDATFTQLAAGS